MRKRREPFCMVIILIDLMSNSYPFLLFALGTLPIKLDHLLLPMMEPTARSYSIPCSTVYTTLGIWRDAQRPGLILPQSMILYQ